MELPKWVTVERATGAHWKLSDSWYYGEGEEGNDSTVNTYCIAFKEGHPAFGETFIQGWPDGTVELPFKENPAGQAQSDFGMYASFAPDRGEVGPYWARMKGNSDVVKGLGLPLNRHVQYWLIYEWVEGTSSDPGLPPEDQLIELIEQITPVVTELVFAEIRRRLQ